MGITRKKRVLHASEQRRPDVQRMRRAFRRRTRLVRRQSSFLDERGINLGTTQHYGWVRRGQCTVGKAPVNVGTNATLTMGLCRVGVVAPLAFGGGTNGPHFEAYLREQLAPRRRWGDVKVVERLGAHRSRAARAAVEACGASFRLLPYSLDPTPVEDVGA